MKIDFYAPILDAKGKQIPIVDTKTGEPTDEINTLRSISEQAMLAPSEGDDKLSALEKVKHYKLFNKISDGVTELTLAEVTLLKERIGKVFTTLVVGRCYDIIEPPDELAEAAE